MLYNKFLLIHPQGKTAGERAKHLHNAELSRRLPFSINLISFHEIHDFMKTIPTALVILATSMLFFGFVSPSFTVNTQNQSQSTPLTCTSQNSNDATSSDGSMYVMAAATVQTCTSMASGTSYWEAYNGGQVHTISEAYVCSQPVFSGKAYDFAGGCEIVGGTLEQYGYQVNYTLSVEHSHVWSAYSGTVVTIYTNGWSGNGAPSSSNQITISASVPP